MYDLIVVGAGPAGASAARAAAQLGLKTLLLEKEKLPRSKLCGGGVTPKVLKLFDFTLPNDLVECAAKSTRIHVGDRLLQFRDRPHTGIHDISHSIRCFPNGESCGSRR